MTHRSTPRPRPRVQTLVLAFQDSERLPDRGDTVIMAGSFGVRYAVSVQRIIARERMPDDGHTILLTVKATRRAITETSEASEASEASA